MSRRQTYTTPDGTLCVVFSGSLADKINILADFGIEYVPTANELEEDVTIQEMRDEYLQAMSNLQLILDEPDPTTVNLALAIRIVRGMRVLARIQRQVLILLRRLYNGD